MPARRNEPPGAIAFIPAFQFQESSPQAVRLVPRTSRASARESHAGIDVHGAERSDSHVPGSGNAGAEAGESLECLMRFGG